MLRGLTEPPLEHGCSGNVKRNVVLIGMPTAGKSTVGRAAAMRLGLDFTDTDVEIVREIGMPIADYFAEYGEKAFRDIESRLVGIISRRGGQVIATGGGTILRPENVRMLKQNGILLFLDRQPEKLLATSDHPLSSDREALMRRYSERYDLYISVADVCIENNGEIEDTVRAVCKEAMK